MLYLAADMTIGRSLELYGEFAESENRIMTRVVRAGDAVVDVGANIGTVTLPLARRVGPNGRVHAFEPQRIVFQHLCANLALNGLANVEAHWAALGAAAEMARIPALDPAATANFGGVRLATEGAGEPVPMTTLDDLALTACALIKLDVEGMEIEVLKGAERTVARHRPAIYFEAKSGDNTRQCIAWLQACHYRLSWHFARFFEPKNFRQRPDDVFAGRGDIYALAVPEESPLQARLPPIRSPDADWQSEYRAWLDAQSKPA